MKTHRENDADPIFHGHCCRLSAGDYLRRCAGADTPAQPVSPPTPEVTFKVEVNYVEEDVRVVDRDGNFVRGLKQEDFQVLEDGKPQKVQTFGMVDIPNTRPRKPLYLGPNALPIEPDVAVNKQVLDGRLYLIVLDDYHVAPLRSQNVKNLARRFVLEKLGPDDQAAVVVTSGLTRASQDFTQNRRLLVEAIDNFVGQKLPSSAVERNEKMSRAMDASGRPTDDAGDPIAVDPSNRFVADDRATERMFQTRQALNSLRSIAEWMSAIQGRRKAIVYLSEGVDYNLFDIFTGGDPSNFNFENFNMVQTETWDTVSAASRSNVQIYPVDPRGLTTMAQEDIEIGGLRCRRVWARPQATPCRSCRRHSRTCGSSPRRPAGLRSSAATTSTRHSIASSRRTARTTCSATTRPTNGATAGCGTSPCAWPATRKRR